LPVSRKTSIGGVSGQLIAEGRPVSRAIIKTGDEYTVTDADGHFMFTSLKPGPRDVEVVGDSLGPKLVMTTSAPAKVHVNGAQSTTVDLNAVRAASVTIRVLRSAFGNGNQLVPAGGQQGTIIELSNGTERLIEETDRLGSATFDRLRVGRWKMRISDSNLPANHILEHPEQEIELKPGQATEIIARVLPVKRKVQMIDQGSVR
jgi:hypothetical protein